jgi:hypothetical protein
MYVADAMARLASDRELAEWLSIQRDFDLRVDSDWGMEQTFPQQGHVLPGESQGVPLLRLEFAS